MRWSEQEVADLLKDKRINAANLARLIGVHPSTLSRVRDRALSRRYDLILSKVAEQSPPTLEKLLQEPNPHHALVRLPPQPISGQKLEITELLAKARDLLAEIEQRVGSLED